MKIHLEELKHQREALDGTKTDHGEVAFGSLREMKRAFKAADAVNLGATPEDCKTINEIVDRYDALLPLFDRPALTGRQRTHLHMDICAVHLNGCPLDLDRFLDAPEPDFVHDVCGIVRHLDRGTGRLRGGFLPRFAAPGQMSLLPESEAGL